MCFSERIDTIFVELQLACLSAWCSCEKKAKNKNKNKKPFTSSYTIIVLRIAALRMPQLSACWRVHDASFEAVLQLGVYCYFVELFPKV